MKRMLEYIRLLWQLLVVRYVLTELQPLLARCPSHQQEKIMALMTDVVALMNTVSGKLDQLLGQAPVATQAQVDAVNDGLTAMNSKLDAALPPAAPPAP